MQIITISRDRLNDIQEAMCDDYCAWPDICANQERLNMHCQECPLNNILNEEEEQKHEV